MSKQLYIYIGIGVLIVAAVVCAGYFLLSRTNTAPVSHSSPVDVSAPGTAKIVQPQNTKKYQSSVYHFSLFYPDNLTVTELAGAGGSMVVLFKNQASQQGFDIFIVPYTEPKITPARFAMDEPSGVMQSPVNITVDGAAATEFFSTNPAMGASREIWFLHGGFLFEVTAPKTLDSWLLQIMQTWQWSL